MWCPIHSRASLRFRLLYTHPRQPALSLQHLNAPYQPLRPYRSHLPLSQKLLRCRYHAGYGSRLLPAFPSLKCSLIRSSRPGGQTALRHHRDLAMMGQSWVHPRVSPHLLHLTWVMSLLQLLSYPPYVNTQYTVPGCSRDCIMRSDYSLSLKRANSHRVDEQIKAPTPLPL